MLLYWYEYSYAHNPVALSTDCTRVRFYGLRMANVYSGHWWHHTLHVGRWATAQERVLYITRTPLDSTKTGIVYSSPP